MLKIISNKEILAGEPIFEGTRLSVKNIKMQLKRGVSSKIILEDYPYLTTEDLNNAWSYKISCNGCDGSGWNNGFLCDFCDEACCCYIDDKKCLIHGQND
jgi:uncharacterized protein (DUF433 family)